MKHLKKFGLLLVVALAGMSLAAASASATVEVEDASGDPYDGPFAGFQESGVLEGALDVTCDSTSTVHGDVNSDGTGTVEVDFNNCTSALGSCTVVVNNDNALDFHIEEPVVNGSAHFVLESAVDAVITCAGIECEFDAAAGAIEGPITGGDPGEVSFNQQPLTGPGGLCGNEGHWTSHFIIDEPADGLFLHSA